MGRLRVIHPTAWFCILAFLPATLGSVDGKVWCIGDDGHVALETADFHAPFQSLAVSARNDFSSGGRRAPGVASCCTHCGPCTDFPALSMDMSRDPAWRSPAFHPIHPLPVEHVAPRSLTNLASREPIPCMARQGSRPDPTAVSLRTTVLLI